MQSLSLLTFLNSVLLMTSSQRHTIKVIHNYNVAIQKGDP